MHRFAPTVLLSCALAATAAGAGPSGHEGAFKPGESFRECAVCPEMVVLPAGSFTMGSPESEKGRNSWEGPQHVVTFVHPFAVGKFEVTVEQFAAFVRETSYDAGSSCWTIEGGTFNDRSGRSWRHPGYEQTRSHPAACVSWRDAKAYAEWLSRKTGATYRLLTEAEWEYAARAHVGPGPAPRYSYGDDESKICSHGNGLDQAAKGSLAGAGSWDFVACGDGHAFTAAAGRYAPNGFGLHDMLGNVKEWTEDCFHEGRGYRGAPFDGSAWVNGDCRFRVLRGGSWLSYGRLLRAAMRFRGGPDDRSNDVGFRVARTLPAH
jgi:formylglycine-generating enzyme required for sulfatase activity